MFLVLHVLTYTPSASASASFSEISASAFASAALFGFSSAMTAVAFFNLLASSSAACGEFSGHGGWRELVRGDLRIGNPICHTFPRLGYVAFHHPLIGL